MGIDLVSRRARLNTKILVDRCEIWRDTQGALDDQVDPATGAVTGPVNDSALVTASDCKLKLQLRRIATAEGGEPVVISEYELLLPIPMPAGEAKDGDRIKITASGHDPSLQGKWLRAAEVVYGSLTVFRRVKCELRERPSDRP